MLRPYGTRESVRALLHEEPDGERHAAATPNQLYIFLPERTNELAQIQAEFPGGDVQTFTGYYTDPLFSVYEVNN